MPTSSPGPLLPDDHPLMAAMTKRDPNAPEPSFLDLFEPDTEVHELEAIPAGLSPDQEIRARALDAAITFVDEAADWDDATQGVAPVLAVARRFAAWIADGDPAPAQDTAFEGSVSAVEATEPAVGTSGGGAGE